jgi:hypothetical protein
VKTLSVNVRRDRSSVGCEASRVRTELLQMLEPMEFVESEELVSGRRAL